MLYKNLSGLLEEDVGLELRDLDSPVE